MSSITLKPTKFYIRETSGMFLEWESGIDVLPVTGQAFYVQGGQGADSVYIGNGTKVDVRELGSGADKIYLQGNLADYDISVSAFIWCSRSRRIVIKQHDAIRKYNIYILKYLNLFIFTFLKLKNNQLILDYLSGTENGNGVSFY